MVTVAVIVTPGPVFFLFLRRNSAEVAVRVAMGFVGPAMVVNNLVIVPHVVVGVVRIVNAIVVMMLAGDSCSSELNGCEPRLMVVLLRKANTVKAD